MNNELWKEIENYDNYMVSNFGNVKNVKTGRILKPVLSQGYLQVMLCVNSIKTVLKIHKLVADAFLPDAENDEQTIIDHINRQRADNHYLNLRWVSSKQNSQNSTKRQNTSSYYKGVCFNKKANKWQAQIVINAKKKYLGLFDTQKEGAIAYNTACDIYFGEYANKNIISDDE